MCFLTNYLIYQVLNPKLKGKFNLLFICSYAVDEPIVEVIEAMEEINNNDVVLYISGDFKKLEEKIYKNAPKNVVFTGFLSEEEYIKMLNSVKAILVLTKSEFTMMCGCYEAISVCKPIVTSNKNVLVDYFKGNVFVENYSDSIRSGIFEIIKNYQKYYNNCCELKSSISLQWNYNFQKLLEELSTMKKKKKRL